MKRAKRIYILLGVLAAACIATVAVIGVKKEKEKIKNSGDTILQISEDSIKALSWKSGEDTDTLSFHKNDEKWSYDSDDAFPVDAEKIKELVKPFEDFAADFIIEEVEDYSQYGLSSPFCTINMETEDKNYEIKLGDFSKMDSERYVDIGDGNVYLMKHDPYEEFDAKLSDVIKNDELPDFEKVKDIAFSGNESLDVIYDENNSNSYREDDVYFCGDGKNLPLDTELVNKYLRSVSNLSLKEYTTYKATEEEISEYGLDAPELKMSVNYTETGEDKKETDKTFVISVTRDPKEKAEEEKNKDKKEEKEDKKDTKEASEGDQEDAEEEKITAYARINDSPIIYKITGQEYKELVKAPYDSLRHQEIVPINMEDVSKVEISLDGENYIVTSKKEKEDKVLYYKDEKLENTDFTDKLAALKADSFTDISYEEKEEIGFTVIPYNKEFPQIRIDIYRYDREFCIAEVDGKPLAFVPRADVVALVEAVNNIVLETPEVK